MIASKILRAAGLEVPDEVLVAETPTSDLGLANAWYDRMHAAVAMEALAHEVVKWKQRADALESQVERGTVFNEATMATLREREQEAKP